MAQAFLAAEAVRVVDTSESDDEVPCLVDCDTPELRYNADHHDEFPAGTYD